MVEEIEEFGAELDVSGFGNAEIFEDGEIPIGVARPDTDVASGVAELLDWRIRIRNDLGERRSIKPSGCGSWSRVWIQSRDNVRAVGREAGDFGSAALIGDIRGIEDGERCSAHQRGDAVELPSAEHSLRDAAGLKEERKAPLIAEHEAVAGIEQRGAALGAKVERVLRQVIFSRDRFRGGTGHVKGGSVVDGFGVGVRRQERNAIAKAFFDAGFQRVVAGIGDAGDETG